MPGLPLASMWMHAVTPSAMAESTGTSTNSDGNRSTGGCDAQDRLMRRRESEPSATIGDGTASMGKTTKRSLEVNVGIICPGPPNHHPPPQSIQMKSEKGANMPASVTASTA
jgi:hypothetical protein